MPSDRFRTIFENHIKQFVGYFSEDANSLFLNERNKLIHPGEFGKYREESCKQVLKIILDKQIAISDGFIITSNNDITTQCDIVGYNSMISPIISDGIAKMFPAEEVSIIGEVKSTLSRIDYIDALRKLALNKQKVLGGRKGNGADKYNSKTYDTIITFLLCSKLSFDYKNLDYEEIYTGIERSNWHNMVLSIEDGLFTYALDFGQASDKTQEELVNDGYILENIASVPYPLHYFREELILTRENHIYVKPEDKYHHIVDFLVNVSIASKDIRIYSYDPIEYLGFNITPFFTE